LSFNIVKERLGLSKLQIQLCKRIKKRNFIHHQIKKSVD